MHAADPELVARYFDHGATSFPKPAAVGRAMMEYLDGIGGTYGRAAYLQAQDASRIVFETRERLARRFGIPDSSRIVFTLNATHALNLAIQGISPEGGAVLVSPLEHNSVMRPLSTLARRRGLRVEVLPHDPRDGRILPERLALRGDERLAVVSHQSNVNGVIQPVSALRERLGAVPLLLDAAQSAGELDIDVSRDGADMLALSGHKHLMGPTGTGALYVREGIELEPLMPGGTGSRSESTRQPEAMPDRLEGGTPNLAGIAGLGAALTFMEERGPRPSGPMAVEALSRLASVPGVTTFGAADPAFQGGLFSFNIAGLAPSEAARRLFERHGLAVRAGLHCSPAAHETLGTLAAGGTVRCGFGWFHDEPSIDLLVGCISDVAGSR